MESSSALARTTCFLFSIVLTATPAANSTVPVASSTTSTAARAGEQQRIRRDSGHTRRDCCREVRFRADLTRGSCSGVLEYRPRLCQRAIRDRHEANARRGREQLIGDGLGHVAGADHTDADWLTTGFTLILQDIYGGHGSVPFSLGKRKCYRGGAPTNGEASNACQPWSAAEIMHGSSGHAMPNAGSFQSAPVAASRLYG